MLYILFSGIMIVISMVQRYAKIFILNDIILLIFDTIYYIICFFCVKAAFFAKNIVYIYHLTDTFSILHQTILFFLFNIMYCGMVNKKGGIMRFHLFI